MLFNSVEFLPFLLVTLVGFYLCIPRSHWRARKAFLTVASYAFYMSWSPFFGLLLLGSTLSDYVVGRVMERTVRPGARRALLMVSVAVNLGLLGYFKYGGFVATNVAWAFGTEVPPALASIILPVGISFYTFESLSYTIDVYRGSPACRSLLDFALFLSFFPHLVAGPIVRPWQFLPQLDAPPRVQPAQVEEALARIATGFVKKLVFADSLGAYVDAVFVSPATHDGGNVLLAIYAYAFQIYFDFSGYCDIAIGLARLFGFELPENFARPYAALSPREFWQRWHITLSTWLRDYLYVPLGGSRASPVRTRINLLVTMLLGGLWHGASWNFVVWGGYHGALMALFHRWGRGPLPTSPVRVLLARLLTFHLVCLGWVFFRCHTLAEAAAVLGALAHPGFTRWRLATESLILVGLAAFLHLGPSAAAFRRWLIAQPPWAQGLAYATCVVAVTLLTPGTAQFIYFRF